MNNSLQSLGEIKPVGEQGGSASADPVQKEYEEGKRFLDNGNFGQAAVALHNALVGFEEADNEIGIANAANQLGKLCLAREDFDNSLRHYRRTLEICRKHNDRMSIVAVYDAIIGVYRKSGDFPGALNAGLDLLDSQYDNNNPQGVVDCLEVIAEIYLAMGEKEKAADAYRTISSVHKNFKHGNSAASYQQKAEDLLANG